MSSSIIALLTDYGLQDSYAGVLKAVLLSKAPKARIVDLTHGIAPQNIRQASHYLAISYRYFPKGTLFLCVVDPGVGTKRAILAARTPDYRFLAPDNGLLSDVAALEPKIQFRRVDVRSFMTTPISSTFHGRDIFAPVAAAWTKATNQNTFWNRLGSDEKHPRLLSGLNARIHKKGVEGEIIYFDHFGNAITNIRKQDIPPFRWKTLKVVVRGMIFYGLKQTYGDSRKACALWNSAGHLEIAVPGGSARDLLKNSSKVKVVYA